MVTVLLARAARVQERYGSVTANFIYHKIMLLALIPADYLGCDVMSLLAVAVQVRKMTLEGLNDIYKV